MPERSRDVINISVTIKNRFRNWPQIVTNSKANTVKNIVTIKQLFSTFNSTSILIIYVFLGY